MRRRAGFTLVEMLVSVALVLFIMVILTEAFGKGLESFRTLKAIGDMEARLRAAASILRRDLAADHFEGKRRLSDPVARWNGMGPPREGFFRIQQNYAGGATGEGTDSDSIAYRRQRDLLYFTVKLRGNNRSEFFYADLTTPSGGVASPLLSPAVRTTFFDQPSDARFQDTPNSYAGQWAEVLYVPRDNGTKTPRGDTLYTLYRGQLVVVADNSKLNWIPFAPGCPIPASAANTAQHTEMSCHNRNNSLYFSNPSDLVVGTDRTFARRPILEWPLTPVLTDVISFNVEYMPDNDDNFLNVDNPARDTEIWGRPGVNWTGDPHYQRPIRAMRITLRVWDVKTRQTRQITLTQDM